MICLKFITHTKDLEQIVTYFQQTLKHLLPSKFVTLYVDVLINLFNIATICFLWLMVGTCYTIRTQDFLQIMFEFDCLTLQSTVRMFVHSIEIINSFQLIIVM